MYIFEVIRAPEVSSEKFESAIYCARTCIESILNAPSIDISIVNDTIYINCIDEDKPINITFSECVKRIKGCFQDANGNTYPEFNKIIKQQKT